MMAQRHEKAAKDFLIGQKIEIKDATNKQLLGLAGTVTDETKNTIVIETPGGKKIIVKEQVTIEVNGKEINGTSLIGRIEARIKH